jgi:hypothetical protein
LLRKGLEGELQSLERHLYREDLSRGQRDYEMRDEQDLLTDIHIEECFVGYGVVQDVHRGECWVPGLCQAQSECGSFVSSCVR